MSPQLAHRVESLRCEGSDAIGAKRTCREPRKRVDLTKMTHCGHRLDRNPAAQQSPTAPRCAIVWGGSTGGGRQRPTWIQNDSDLAQGLAGWAAAGERAVDPASGPVRDDARRQGRKSPCSA